MCGDQHTVIYLTLIKHTMLHNAVTSYTQTIHVTPLYVLLYSYIIRLVTIHNRSDVIVHYEWKAFATEEEEQMEKEMYYK